MELLFSLILVRKTEVFVICMVQIKLSMRVPKLPVIFLQENTKFYSCTQTAIRFSTTKHKILKTVTKRPFMFLQRNI